MNWYSSDSTLDVSLKQQLPTRYNINYNYYSQVNLLDLLVQDILNFQYYEGVPETK